MRKTTYFLFISVAAAALSSCSMKQPEKITDVPVTSQSAEAKASMQAGLTALDQNDFQKAREYFTKAIQQDPKLGIAYAFRAQTSQSPKEFADDINNAKANVANASEYEKLYSELDESMLNNDWNKRLEVCQKIASAYPDAARAQLDLGFTYGAGNQFDKAIQCYQKAVELNPKWVGGYTALVNAYIFTEPKDFKKAEENALKAVELAPKSPGAEIALGDCYRAQNNLEKAREAYGKAIELDPNASEGYYKKGHANSFLGNYDEARQNYTEAMKHDESRMAGTFAIGNSYLYAGDTKAAIGYLEQQFKAFDGSGESAGRITAGKANCLMNVASIAMQAGDVAKLKETVAAIDPLNMQMANDNGTEAGKLNAQATSLYWQSIIASLENNFDVAKAKAEEIKKTLESVKDPNKLDQYEFALGFAAMKQKNFSEAVNHFGKTLQVNVYNKYWLALANEAAGNKDKATALLNDISNYNFNEIGYALIRSDVKKKLGANM